MNPSPRIDCASSTSLNSPPFHSGLSPFAARSLKRRLIVAYCDGRVSESQVQQIFINFPELKGA